MTEQVWQPHPAHKDFCIPLDDAQKWCVHKALVHCLVPLEEVDYDPANARLHGSRNLNAIGTSYDEFGQRKNVVLQKKQDGRYMVRAGNGSIEAVTARGWTHVAAVVIEEDDSRAVAFAIADNRTAELAEWDEDVLTTWLRQLEPELVEAAGFTEDEIQALEAEWLIEGEDTSSIDDYDEEKDTFIIKIDGVSREHRDELVDQINQLLSSEGAPYEAVAY